MQIAYVVILEMNMLLKASNNETVDNYKVID